VPRVKDGASRDGEREVLKDEGRCSFSDIKGQGGERFIAKPGSVTKKATKSVVEIGIKLIGAGIVE
jgi:hypothetical protein